MLRARHGGETSVGGVPVGRGLPLDVGKFVDQPRLDVDAHQGGLGGIEARAGQILYNLHDGTGDDARAGEGHGGRASGTGAGGDRQGFLHLHAKAACAEVNELIPVAPLDCVR